jgi:hypothetical protein
MSLKRSLIEQQHRPILGQPPAWWGFRHGLLSYMKYYNGARTHLSLEKEHRSRAPSIAPGTFFVAQPWADCITNMPGFNLRQALVKRKLRLKFRVA